MNEMPKAGEICWTELSTTNAKAAKDFYGTVFGWEFTDHNMGDMTYTMIKYNNKDFGGIWSIPKDKEKEVPPHWMSYILVENLDTALQNASKAGASIAKPATPVGEMGRFGIIIDPTGAQIALWQALRQAV